MNFNFHEGPIIAVSTGTSERSALGIIRISGFENLQFLADITGKSDFLKPKSRRVYFSKFYDERGTLLDEGVFTYFKGPRSFTGENTLELTLHGNPFNLERITSYLRKTYGFRLAKPGEFSFRALKNKKLNLTQIEGLDLILNASSEYGLNSGLKALNNELFQSYQSLRSLIIEIKASVEILIDFSEDVGEEQIRAKLDRDFLLFKKELTQLHQRCQGQVNHLLSPAISLVGETNAGKSTFFNKWLGQNRAIVSEIHGTTRDYISEFIYLEGMAFRLIDTAGIRESAEEVEKIGIKKSYEINKNSFFKILVVNPFSFSKDFSWSGGLSVDAVILSHADCEGFEEAATSILEKLPQVPIYRSGSIGANSESGSIGANSESGSIGANSESGPMGASSESGPMGASSESGPMGASSESGPMGASSESGPMGAEITLESMIIKQYQTLKEINPIPFERHRHIISMAYGEVNKIQLDERAFDDCAVLSHHINILATKMDELVGIVSPQEVLDHIFANFCIGK